jgi:hypothetical protein
MYLYIDNAGVARGWNSTDALKSHRAQQAGKRGSQFHQVNPVCVVWKMFLAAPADRSSNGLESQCVCVREYTNSLSERPPRPTRPTSPGLVPILVRDICVRVIYRKTTSANKANSSGSRAHPM